MFTRSCVVSLRKVLGGDQSFQAGRRRDERLSAGFSTGSFIGARLFRMSPALGDHLRLHRVSQPFVRHRVSVVRRTSEGMQVPEKDQTRNR